MTATAASARADTSGTAATRRLDDLAPIGLDELIERASLQTRIDRKYVVPICAVDDILADLGGGTRVLEMAGIRDFRYESVYFDTPDLASYRMAAQARRRRFKARTRAYVDSATAYLEVKTRGARAATVKERLEYEFDDRDRLNHDGLDYVGETLGTAGFDDIDAEALVPTLVTRYRRATLFVPGDPSHGESRATVDTALDWSLGATAEGIATPTIAIVETKSGSRASAVDRILWSHGHRPSTISKYGTGLAALRGDLPANKWSRILRRHFSPSALSPSSAP